jgi:hypothetical protein
MAFTGLGSKISISAGLSSTYDDDATTPLLTFNLKDSSGNPTEDSPIERVPA